MASVLWDGGNQEASNGMGGTFITQAGNEMSFCIGVCGGGEGGRG